MLHVHSCRAAHVTFSQWPIFVDLFIEFILAVEQFKLDLWPCGLLTENYHRRSGGGKNARPITVSGSGEEAKSPRKGVGSVCIEKSMWLARSWESNPALCTVKSAAQPLGHPKGWRGRTGWTAAGRNNVRRIGRKKTVRVVKIELCPLGYESGIYQFALPSHSGRLAFHLGS